MREIAAACAGAVFFLGFSDMAAAIVGDINFDNIGHLAAASQMQGDLADDMAYDGKEIREEVSECQVSVCQRLSLTL